MAQKALVKTHTAKLTVLADTRPELVKVDDAARLRQIRQLVEANNQSTLGTDVIICQIYMESRFDSGAQAPGSSARGLMQLLKAPVRELYRLRNMKRPKGERMKESDLYIEADRFHDSPGLVEEATNIQTGTAYLQALIDRRTADGQSDPVAEAYKDYRGVRNGVYYKKIREAAGKLSASPDSMQVLRDMVR